MQNSNIIKNFVLNKKNSLFENIFLCFAITLASAFFSFDNYYGFMDILRVVTIVLLLAAWLWCGFVSGKNKSWGFLIFTAVYWAAPFLYMLFYSTRDNVRGYSKWLSLLNKISDLLFNKPFCVITEWTKRDSLFFACILIVMTGLTYVIGFNFAAIMRKSYARDEQAEESDENEADEAEKSDED